MSLLDEAFVDCQFITQSRASDGMGGYITVYTDGADFQAAIVLDNSLQARMAEKSGVTGIFTITVRKNTPLSYHEIFRRKSDGKVFRVTSEDKQTPNSAGLNMRQVTAEEYILE